MGLATLKARTKFSLARYDTIKPCLKKADNLPLYGRWRKPCRGYC